MTLYLKALRHVDGVSSNGCMFLSTRKASHRCKHATFQASCSSVRSLHFLDCTGDSGCHCCELHSYTYHALAAKLRRRAHLYG